MTSAIDPYRHMTVKHHFIGGIYTKETHLPPGYAFVQHRHSFAHQSILVSGKAILDVEGVKTELEGPAILTIEAKKFHAITALTPVVWLCQHVTSCTDPDEVDMEIVEPGSTAEVALAATNAIDVVATEAAFGGASCRM